MRKRGRRRGRARGRAEPEEEESASETATAQAPPPPSAFDKGADDRAAQLRKSAALATACRLHETVSSAGEHNEHEEVMRDVMLPIDVRLYTNLPTQICVQRTSQ
jgi:hypothetical protein